MHNEISDKLKEQEEQICKLSSEIKKRDNIINLLTSVLEVVKTDINIKTQQLDFLIGKMKNHDYNYFESKMKIESFNEKLNSHDSNKTIVFDDIKKNIFFKKSELDEFNLDRIIQIESKNYEITSKNNYCKNFLFDENNNINNDKKKKIIKDYFKSINIKKGFNRISFDDYSISYSKNTLNSIDNKIEKIINTNKKQTSEDFDYQDSEIPKKSFLNLNIPSNEYISLFILNYLNSSDLLNLSLANKSFNTLSKSNKFWNKLYFKENSHIMHFDKNDTYNIIENAKEIYNNFVDSENTKFPLNSDLILNKSKFRKNFKNENKNKSKNNEIYYKHGFSDMEGNIIEKNEENVNTNKIKLFNDKKFEYKKISNPLNYYNIKILQSLDFKKKFFELNKLNKNWETGRPIVTTISTTECITGLNLNSKSNELICTSSDGTASLYKLYSYRKNYDFNTFSDKYDFNTNDEGNFTDLSNFKNNQVNTQTNFQKYNSANKFYLHMQHHKQTKICDMMINYKGHSGPIWCLERNEDILFTGSYDKTIKIWEIPTGTCLNTIRAHSNWVSSLNYWKNSNLLISSSWDCTIKLWKIMDYSIENSFILQNEIGNYIYCVRENLSNAELVSGNEFKTIDIWDINKRIKKSSFYGHLERINDLKICNKINSLISGNTNNDNFNNNLILSGSEDKNIRLWDARTNQCEILFSGHKRGITQVEYDWINNRVISSSMDKTIKIWDIRKNQEIRTLIGHSSAVYSIVGDQTKIISGSKDNSIRIWNFLD